MRIDGKQTYLVPFAEQHLRNPIYLAWLQDPQVVRTLNLPHYLARPVSFKELEAYYRRVVDSATDLFLALHRKCDDAFIGTLKAAQIDRYAGTADLGIMIGHKNLWGQGLASDALHALARHLFEVEGLRRLTAGAMATNPAMIRVFERLGFRREGVFREQDRLGNDYIDHIHLGCLRNEFAHPAIPRPK